MTTASALRDRILRLLGDVSGVGYSNDLLLDSMGAAFDAILPNIPKTALTTFTGDGSSTAFTLPADLYEVQSIVDTTTGAILDKAVLAPGVYRGLQTSSSNDWIEYPAGSITFSKPLPSGVIYQLFYLAKWTKPTDALDNGTELEPPEYAMHALSLYAAAWSLIPTSVGVSEIRPYATRPDLGTPEDNPAQKTITFLLRLFQQELNRHPKLTKAQT